jgi:hypothetical protein
MSKSETMNFGVQISFATPRFASVIPAQAGIQ